MILDVTYMINKDNTSGLKLLQLDVKRKNLKGIIIMQDKARIELEARILILIIILKEASWVISIIMVRDYN